MPEPAGSQNFIHPHNNTIVPTVGQFSTPQDDVSQSVPLPGTQNSIFGADQLASKLVALKHIQMMGWQNLLAPLLQNMVNNEEPAMIDENEVETTADIFGTLFALQINI